MDGNVEDMGVLNVDQATQIWQNILTAGQLRSIGLKEEPNQSPNKAAKRPKTDKAKQMPMKPRGNAPDMMQLMARMALRQEDTINSLLTEHQFLVHVNIGKGSILPELIQVTQHWKTDKTVDKAPLRHQLALTMMTQLRDRVQKLSVSQTNDEVVKECWRFHVLNQNMEMPFLRWNPKTQGLEPTTDKCLTIAETLKHLEGIVRLMTDCTTTVRFHSMRRLPDTPQQATPWIWTVSSRNSPELWHQVKFLTFHACWQLIQCRVKSHTMQRSAMAQQLSKML